MAEKAGKAYFELMTSAENTKERMEQLRNARWEIGTLEDMVLQASEDLDAADPDDPELIDKLQDQIIKLSFDLTATRKEYQEMLTLYDIYYAQMHNDHLPN